MSLVEKALVTGASSGIGRAVAERLCREGTPVVGIARSFAGRPQLDGLIPVELDLADLDALPEALGRLIKEHPEIEAVVSNAGAGRFGSLEEQSYEQIRSQLELNLISHAFVARAVLPALKRRGGGRLLFIGSEAALRGSRRGAVYCAAKFGVRGLAQALREEAGGAGVGVTIVNPGMVRTEFFDELGFAPGAEPENALTAEEVASAVWLALSSRPGAVVDEINLSPLKRVVTSKGR